MADHQSFDDSGEPMVMVMDQSTQFDGETEFDWYGYFRCFAKVLVLICGLLSIYILNRLSDGSLPCNCTNEVPCLNQQSVLVNILRRVWGK